MAAPNNQKTVKLETACSWLLGTHQFAAEEMGPTQISYISPGFPPCQATWPVCSLAMAFPAQSSQDGTFEVRPIL